MDTEEDMPRPDELRDGTLAEVKAALVEVDKQFKAGQDALKKGDWTAYGKAQKELEDALNKAIELDK